MTHYLSVLDSWRCPTCGNSLARRAPHCGEESSHLLRRSQPGAAKLLRVLYHVPAGADLDTALIAAQALPRPAHRPRRDPAAARVAKGYRLHPTTADRIAAESRRTGESQGQVIDRIISAILGGQGDMLCT